MLGLLLLVSMSSAQDIKYEDKVENLNSYFNEAYSLDQTLINGPKYYNLYPGTSGHAFLFDDFVEGSINLKGKNYNNLSLNYDLLNQKILLKYKNHYGGLEQIYINEKEVNSFTLENKKFIKNTVDETGEKIFQEIKGNRITLLMHWKKNLVKQSSSTLSYYKFSPSRRKVYLLIENNLTPLSGKRSFIKEFPKENQKVIKKFMQANQISLKQSSDRHLKMLIGFCETLNEVK